MKRGIVHSDMPGTFRDAVTITRVMGVKYLWIDSLCIIQNPACPGDWLTESSNMLTYYKTAYVTISGLDAKDSFSGFLCLRNEKRLTFPDGTFIRSKTPSMTEMQEGSVLASRAWCLQERLISTRILHFGRSNLAWECQTESRIEGINHTNSLTLRYEFSSGDSLVMKRALVPLKRGSASEKLALSTWYFLVGEYSGRNPTFPKDKLRAIAAIANETQMAIGYTYMSGLWKEDLNKGLVWRRAQQDHVPIPNRFKTGDRMKTGAPTWSWASRTDRVTFDFSHPRESGAEFTHKLELLSWTSENGQEIVLKGKCRQITVSRDFRKESCSLARVQELAFSTLIDYDGSLERLMGFVRDESEANDLGRVHLDDANCFLDEEVYRAKAIENLSCSFNRITGLRTRHHFLVLMPHESKKGKWVRVGLGIAYPTIMESRVQNVWPVDRPSKKGALPYMFDGCDYETLCIL
jgi:hypothetical protein